MTRRPSYVGLLSVHVALLYAAAGHAEAQEAPQTATQAAEAASPASTGPAAGAEPQLTDNPWFSVGWPKVQMPKFSWKPWGGAENGAQQTPAENPVSQALDRVADTSKRAASSVRGAWGSAMNKFSSFGATPNKEAVAKSDGPGIFSRFFGQTEEPKTPQTVSEFLAQERGKTTLK